MSVEKLLDKIPEQTAKKLGSGNNLLLLSSHAIFEAIKEKNVIIMACNIRLKHVVPGIMRAAEEMDAIVGYELARSEGNLKGGYTGQTPYIFFDMISGYAKETSLTKPFFIHADHTAVRNTDPGEYKIAEDIIKAVIEAGYTSVAIDASHNETEDNIAISSKLGKLVQEAGLGLEVEIGEIQLVKDGGAISTVEDSLEFINGLKQNNVIPDLLAINNGSKHGNYAAGEDVSIDLKRTGEIYNAIKKYGITIAQHGITGTPLNMVGQFADYGIRKGNVGTEWQNIAHRNLPEDLFGEMKKWCQENNKDIKMATKQFKSRIDNIPDEYKKKTADEAYRVAKEYIKAFRAEGSASMLTKSINN